MGNYLHHHESGLLCRSSTGKISRLPAGNCRWAMLLCCWWIDDLFDLEEEMNSVKLSDGTRMKRSVFDRKVREAKQEKIDEALDEFGFIVCQDCLRNDCVPVDCSHEISVKECIETGRAELAFDKNNIKFRGRRCHAKIDGNCIMNPRIK